MPTNLELAVLSEDVYHNMSQLTGNKWKAVGIPIKNDASGFYSRLYAHNNEYVIAMRGTEITDWGDLVADFGIIRRKFGVQFLNALNAYNVYLGQARKASLTITGHSLGGALAKYVAAKHGVNAVAFNAPGIKGMGGLSSKHAKATIHNVNAILDPVSKFGDSFGTSEHIMVSGIPIIPDILEPVLVGKLVIDTGGLAKGFILGAFLTAKHSISNLVIALEKKASTKAAKYRPRRRYGPPGKGFRRR